MLGERTRRKELGRAKNEQQLCMMVREAGRGARRRPAQARRTARKHGRNFGVLFVPATVGRTTAALGRVAQKELSLDGEDRAGCGVAHAHHDMVHDHERSINSHMSALQFWREREGKCLGARTQGIPSESRLSFVLHRGQAHLPLLKEMLEAADHGDKSLLDDSGPWIHRRRRDGCAGPWQESGWWHQASRLPSPQMVSCHAWSR